MPSLEASDRPSYAVLWAALGTSDDRGEPLTDEPREIRVRWEDVNKAAVDARGANIGLDAEVTVNEDVPLDSELWHGKLETWYGADGSAGDDNNVMYVRVSRKVPDVKGRNVRYVLGLSKFRNAPG
jgi:hypothetical protein